MPLIKSDKYGCWTGTGGSDPLTNAQQEALGLGTKERFYRFAHDRFNPLTFHHPNGNKYRPEDGLIHNYGSVPRLAQLVPGFEKDRHPDAYTLHDQCYKNRKGGRHVVLVSRDGGRTWNRETITRPEADYMLYLSIVAEKELPEYRIKTNAAAIYAVVAAFGGANWKEED